MELHDIPGYDGLYAVTKDGRVWSYPKPRSRQGRWLAQSSDNNGYKVVTLSKDCRQRRWYVHRLVALTFLPNPAEKPHINHKDINPANNRVDNLEWCTASENMLHAVANNLAYHPKGELNYGNKLTPNEVRQIRSMRKGGMTLRSVAQKYDVTESTVSRIANGVGWTHLPL